MTEDGRTSSIFCLPSKTKGVKRIFSEYQNKNFTFVSFKNTPPMKNLFLFFAFTTILFSGCNGNKENPEDSAIGQGMMELDLSQYGMNLSIFVPDSTIGTLEVTAQSYGDIEIRVGTYFQIKIAPGGDLALKKSDLEGDLLFKTTIIKEDPNMIIYKSDLPDGSKSFHHFYMIVNAGGANYEVSDIGDSGEAFSEAIVNKMVEAAHSLKPKEKTS